MGLYVQHLSLAALFFLGIDDSNRSSSLPEAIMMLLLVVITAFAQVTLRNAYRRASILKFLARALVH